MELQFQALFLFFAFLFSINLLRVITRRPKSVNTSKIPPPGPYKLPFLGNIHNLIGSCPHQKLRDLADKYGPLMQLKLGENPVVVVSSPEVAKEVMKIHDTVFAQRPRDLLVSKITAYNALDIVFSPYGDYWRQLRKICIVELLSSKRVESFRPIRESEVENLVKVIASKEGSPINLSKMIFSLMYNITSRAAFGGRSRGQEVFVECISESTKLASGFCLADLYPSCQMLQWISISRMKLEKLHQQADQILEGILEDHREKKGEGFHGEEDLVDVLLRLQQQQELQLSDINIKAVIHDVFSAGSETSSTVTEWAISELLKNPKLLQRAQAEVRNVFNSTGRVGEKSIHEMKFLKALVKETLRLHPSAPLLVARECRKSCTIKGYEVQEKARVLTNAWAIHRDPNYWKDPERFCPDRFLGEGSVDYKGSDFQYIPFGAGRRICPGISFAIADIELPLAELLYYFDWRFTDGTTPEELDMTENYGLTVRRKNDLVLVPVRHPPLENILV
ncbi:PREDICTED: cytochrome P450 71D11-like [Tarenaya hassleriana]|uniref:cytochrome P450 71D11-like n=1 Tax=Tarenaya hassleriana TaxID=28532 RepID=UPI00053C813B|nr:PREDICTED: cytochrome P450 71D11-like [Tarenaya hassleriana]